MKPEPLVVLATPHSQAAHVAHVLGGHPRALALPELRLFSGDRVGDVLALSEHGDDRNSDGLLRAIAWLFYGDQQDRQVTDAQRFLDRRRDWSTTALLDLITDRIAPRVAVFHDITAPMHIVELDRWRDAAPAATFVHLLRHPLTFVEAATQAMNERLYIPPDYSDHAGYPRLAPELLWFRVHDTLQRELVPADAAALSCRRLRLEDLQRRPARTLSALCQWLGWRHDDTVIRAMLDSHDAPFAGPGPRSAPAGAEREFLQQPEFVSLLGARADTGRLGQAPLASEIIERAFSYGYG